MKRILFYISGHGYGHATRSIEVVKALQELDERVEVIFETDAAPWLFPLNLRGRYRLLQRQTDVGVVQQDSYFADKLATLQAFAAFYRTFEEHIREDRRLIRNRGVELVVGDIPPLAFQVAEAAGISAVAIANFSWDWIYAPYAGDYPEYRWVVDAIRRAYGKCTLLLELPFAGDLSAFPVRRRIPAIARHATRPAGEVRAALGLSGDTPMILVALRPADLKRVNLQPLMRLRDLAFVFFAPVPEAANFLSVAPDAFIFPNLVRAADIVVSKPGYGIVSECLANRTPLLFAPRQHFGEYGILEQHLLSTGTGYRLTVAEFFAGEWRTALETLLSRDISWPPIGTNGAQIAAREILKMLQGAGTAAEGTVTS